MVSLYLGEAGLASTAQKLKTGTLDLKEHINYSLDRLEDLDQEIQSFLPEMGRRARLLKEAEALLSAYPDPKKRPPLFGILFGVKDVFHVSGFTTRAGSNLDPKVLSAEEGSAVRTLKQAGALVMGKTVTTEFAYFAPGLTRNPHNLEHTPGGSSSGSAAAVAAGFVPLALGTQTIGSIIRPAAFCGVVGFKPSYNRISTSGLIHFSPAADHVGYFTQDLEGMILVASILCHDWHELKVNRLPVLGIPEGRYLAQAGEEALKAFESQVFVLEEAGYEIKRVNMLDDIDDAGKWHHRLVAAEMASEHRELYPAYGHLYRSVTAGLIEEGLKVSASDLAKARNKQKELREKIEETIRQAGFDLLITPAALGPAPEGLGATGDPAMNMPWTNTGLPALSIPAGQSACGLPLGLQLVSFFMGDELLLTWAKGVAEVFARFQPYNA